jgi:hypothetical protein
VERCNQALHFYTAYVISVEDNDQISGIRLEISEVNNTGGKMNRDMRLITSLLLAFFCLLFVTPCPQTSSAQTRTQGGSGKEVFSGNIIFFDGTFGPGYRRGRGSGTSTDYFTMTINSLSSENEVQNLLSALQSGGQDSLKRVLSKEKRGTIQIGNGIGRDVQAVWVTQTEEGRRISAISERWLGFGELRRGSRSTDYPFTYIEIYTEDDGKGEGTLIPAARLRSKGGNNIEVENFGIYPARLTNIKQRRK